MEIKGVNRIFVDTNILVFATNEISPWHNLARRELNSLRESGVELVISPQIVREYFAVVTRTQECRRPDVLNAVSQNIRMLQREFTIVEENSKVLTCLFELVRDVPTAGKRIHDANIVATMIAHDIHHLLTHNLTDFEQFTAQISLVPLTESNIGI